MTTAMEQHAQPPPEAEEVELGVRCDECGGDGAVPVRRRGRRGAHAALTHRSRRCPVCFGEGEVISVLTLTEFSALARMTGATAGGAVENARATTCKTS